MGNRAALDEMGKRILDASRTELYLSMRFLGPALHSLGFIMDLSTGTVGTDAVYIRFNPNYLFSLYVERPRLLNRTYLHILLHCVFRHMFTAREKDDPELWDLSCDIAVGAVVDSMEYRVLHELTSEFRQRWYEKLREEIRVLTAERIYQYFLERKRNYLEELQLRQAFALDDHSFWERMEEEEGDSPEEDGGRPPGENDPPGAFDHTGDPSAQKQDDTGRSPEGRPDGQKKDPGGRDRDPASDQDPKRRGNGRDPHGDRQKKDPSGEKDPSREKAPSRPEGRTQREEKARRLKKLEDLNRRWRETSERMEAEIAVTGKAASEERGSLDRILAVTNRRRTDYRAYLRRFAVLREVPEIDPDSFDYGYYYYGLEMYGNMPLVEENEFRERNRIRTLVIAIDTSASCQDVLVQRFLNETAAVLRSIEHFFKTSTVRIIECDDQVQKETVLTKPEEFEKYAAGFHIKGGFGTDFRPVFSYVEEKRRTGQIEEMEALMYFTDGMGIYPKKATDYETAFVFFNDEELDDTQVPDWAVRLYLDGGDGAGRLRQMR